jgi:hypothetical protein
VKFESEKLKLIVRRRKLEMHIDKSYIFKYITVLSAFVTLCQFFVDSFRSFSRITMQSNIYTTSLRSVSTDSIPDHLFLRIKAFD